MATVVAIITSIVVANATQTITTPNAAFITYSLAFGANSAAITPAASRAVLVMGRDTVGGVGQVSLSQTPGIGISWVGLESLSPAAITSGNSSTGGTHIVFISGEHFVDIQTASATTIRIHNASGSPRVSTRIEQTRTRAEAVPLEACEWS